jgi:hypothetical protein
MESLDGGVKVELSATLSSSLDEGSCFSSTSDASKFFEAGSLGYSRTAEGRRLDGLVLGTDGWKVEPLRVDRVYSSYFADTTLFPPGSATFDCALLMRNTRCEWHAAEDLYLD